MQTIDRTPVAEAEAPAGRGLGRVQMLDLRDRHYRLTGPLPEPVRAALDDHREKVDAELHRRTADEGGEWTRRIRYWWEGGWRGDQGYTSECCSYATLHALEDGPLTKAPRRPGQGPIYNPHRLYKAGQAHDEWPGDQYEGTSVRGVAKAAQKAGLIRHYVWGWRMDEVVRLLLDYGPVVVGTIWTERMFWPEPEAGVPGPVLRLDGPIVGGHAYVLNGINLDTGWVRMKNSWGAGWGENGRAYIRIDDMAALIDAAGEACFLVE